MLTEVKISFGTEPFDHDSRLSDKLGDSYSDARSSNDALGRVVEMQVCIGSQTLTSMMWAEAAQIIISIWNQTP